MQQVKNNSPNEGLRVGVQKFGRFLSGMVMPNIGAFIAWGIITALFIPTGWLPNENLAELVDPMITYLLPLLISYTGGSLIHKQRGGVVGALMTIGIIVGTDIPMFLGAMVCGPLAGWVLKQFDNWVEGKVKSGFEMLVNNFSLGIIGAVLTGISYFGVGPLIEQLTRLLSDGVQYMVNHNLIPLVNILIEPAKILFLNNAINHGVLSPIALEEVSRTGESILFMLESNPGPGLGILLAYMIAGRGSAKQSASGAAIIHFFGGVHEIYFPYVLMNPRLIFAGIAGGVAGTFTFSFLDAGLVAPTSPGSIFSFIAMTPKGGLIPVLSGIVVSAIVSFVVAFFLLKTVKKNAESDDLEQISAKMKQMKSAGASGTVSDNEFVKKKEDVHKIVFSCDAGMGSSAMGASILRRKITAAGSDIIVVNTAITEIPDDADIVITHKSLTERAKIQAPQAEHISIDNFLKSPEYDKLVERLT